MSLRAIARAVIPGVVLLFAHGCFKSTSGGSSGCAEGSAGCECYGNGTCDGTTLECNENNKCVEPNCTEGTENCTCADGMCFGTLRCLDDICQADGGTGTEGGSADGPTTGADYCAPEMLDDMCIDCVKGQCCPEYSACRADPSCDCMTTCLDDGNDPITCGMICDETELFWNLEDCAFSKCTDECLMDAACMPEEGDPECRLCAFEYCCGQWVSCQLDEDCNCMEGCAAFGTPAGECATQCGLMDTEPPPEWHDLFDCVSGAGCMTNEPANTFCYQ